MENIAARDTAYVWLRQAAELTLGDQRRTLEIAIPVRPGASPDEIARLLDEAEAGMERLSERIDRRVAALRTGAPASTTTSTARPSAPSPRPSNGVAERPAAAPRSAPSSSPARPQVAATPAAHSGSGPAGTMSRAEFLEQARGLGLDPRQAMDRLGVRTLEGLNYAEALEQIRRQLLRESTEGPRDAAPANSSHPATADAPPTVPAPAPSPVGYFDEEDDYDLTYELPGEDDSGEHDALGAEPDAPALDEAAHTPAKTKRHAPPNEPDELDLDDVPDFAEPPAATRREPATKAPPSGAHAASSSNAEAASTSLPTPLTSHQALAQRARARDLLARLREYRGGTAAGSDQIGPFSNVVVQQLGEEQVAALTDQVWGITPEHLTAQQMRALIQWGKTDPFSTEVEAVLDLLASERATDASGEAKGATARTNRQAARPAGRGSGSAR